MLDPRFRLHPTAGAEFPRSADRPGRRSRPVSLVAYLILCVFKIARPAHAAMTSLNCMEAPCPRPVCPQHSSANLCALKNAKGVQEPSKYAAPSVRGNDVRRTLTPSRFP